MEIHPSTHEVLLICAVDKLCQLSKIKVIKEKKIFFLKISEVWSLQVVSTRKAFEQISDALEKKYKNKNTLVLENWKGYKDRKCIMLKKADTYSLSEQSDAGADSLKNYCKKCLYFCK